MESNDISGALSKLLEDPAALAKAMSIASSLMGSMQGAPKATSDVPVAPASAEPDITVQSAPSAEPSIPVGDTKQTGEAPNIATIASLLGGSSKSDPRCALLYALRPYMGHGRAEKIDTLVNMLHIADLAGGMLGGKLF